MSIKGVVFDMDGVLVDSEGPLSEIAARALQDFEVPAMPSDFHVFIGMGEDAYIGGVAAQYGFDYTMAMKEHVYEKYIELAERFVHAFPGAVELIAALRARGIPVAVASSADRPKVESNLRAMGLWYEDFDAVVTGNDIHRKKPDPDIYLEAALRIGVDPSDCIAVEDAVSGARSARAAGMRCIGVTTSVPIDVLAAAGADPILPGLPTVTEILDV